MRLTRNSRKADHKNNFMPAFLAITLTIMSAAYIAGLMYVPIPDNNKDLIIAFGGQLSILWVLSVQYYFSSTAGSRNKDQLIADSIPVKRDVNAEQN